MATVRERPTTRRPVSIVRWILFGLLALVLAGGARAHDRLAALDRTVNMHWARVASAYQRRSDLTSRLIAIARDAAGVERSTLMAVIEARAGVEAIPREALRDVTWDPAVFALFEQRQSALSAALADILVLAERTPALGAARSFRDLHVALEDVEHRITAERESFNGAARAFNDARNTLPTVLFVRLFRSRFADKPCFEPQAGPTLPPAIDLEPPLVTAR